MADNGPSSSELLRRAGAGDGQALGELFDQYRDRLRRMVQLRLDRRLQGHVVGTLRYMAPERFQGVSDARSDIYSLGLTLYELLTLRPAFDESHREPLLWRIVHQEPPPLSRWDRRVPRDLETVVLKAIAKEPERRYQTAEALAEDLRRFLADRPILARRSWAAERLWRWCRRNRALASLSTALVVLLVMLGAGAIVASLLGQERNKAVAARERAELAEREVKIRSYLSKATAYRRSRQAGQQRFKALAEVAAALQLDPTPELRADLRNEAIACLLLPDFEVEKDWDGWPVGSGGLAFDAAFERYARSDKDGNVSIRRVADDHVLLTLQGTGGSDPYGGLEFSSRRWPRRGRSDRFRSRLRQPHLDDAGHWQFVV
jgi:hypothetical protein